MARKVVSDIIRRKELAEVVAAFREDFDDGLHLLRLTEDQGEDALAELAVVGVEVAEDVFHLHFDGDLGDVRGLDVAGAAADLGEVATERDIGFTFAFFLDACLERFLRLRFAVDDEDFRGLRVLDIRHPADELVGVGMRREAVEALNLRFDGDFFTEDADALDAVDEAAAKAAFRLIADEENRRFRAPEIVLEVMQDAAGIAHARGRDDDGAALFAVERAGFGCRLADAHLRELDDFAAFGK